MNSQLVKGEALIAASKQQGWVDAFNKNFSAVSNEIAQRRKINAIKKERAAAKTASYIESLNSDVDISNLNENQQKSISNFLTKKKMEYANYANQIAKAEVGSNEYMQLRDNMNKVQTSFSNLAGSLKKYKEDKANYIESFDSGLISDGNQGGILEEAANIYTNSGDIGIDDYGNINFWNENNGTYQSYNNIKKPFLKDYKAADSILKLNESIYNAGSPLTGARANMIKQQLNNIVSKGGRETLMSLASDDFIVEGGLGLQDPSLFEPGNEKELKKAVVNSYMETLRESAAQGYSDKQSKTRSAAGPRMTALDQEIASTKNIREDAQNFATLAGLKTEDTEQKAIAIATELNTLDPSDNGEFVSRSVFYNQWLDDNKLDHNEESVGEFISMYPREYQVFYFGGNGGKPVNVNINDPLSLYEYYISNSNMSNKAKNRIITETRNQVNKPAKKESPKEVKTSIDTSKYN